jgi:hypothetical protein
MKGKKDWWAWLALGMALVLFYAWMPAELPGQETVRSTVNWIVNAGRLEYRTGSGFQVLEWRNDADPNKGVYVGDDALGYFVSLRAKADVASRFTDSFEDVFTHRRWLTSLEVLTPAVSGFVYNFDTNGVLMALGTNSIPTVITGSRVQTALGGVTNNIGGWFFKQTALQTVTNTTGATTLLSGSGVTNLAAGALNVAGRTVVFDFAGRYSSAATPGTFTIDVALGGTVVFTTGAITPAVSQTEKGWRLQGQITTRSTGASGTVMGWGNLTVGTNTTGVSVWPMLNATTTTHDLTAAQAIHVRATMSASTAPNNIQCQVGQMRLE